jgi:hypothetical protein
MRAFFAAAVLVATPVLAGEEVDLATVHDIKTEAFLHSKVMDHLFYLSDVHGPRLTASPGYKAAADWAVGALKGFGVQNAALESWGPFGRGWSVTHFQAAMTEPSYAPLAAVVKAWSPGTEGLVKGGVVAAPLQRDASDRYNIDKVEAAIAKYKETWKGKLRGKIVLCDPARDLALPTKAVGERYDDKELADMAAAPDPTSEVEVKLPIRNVPSDPVARRRVFMSAPFEAVDEYFDLLDKTYASLTAFLHDEGAIAAFFTDMRGDGSVLFSEAGAPYKGDGPALAPTVVLAPESYNRLFRLADKKIPVSVELEVAVKIDPPQDGFNVVGEIPGSNPRKKDEIVMIGGHLDSWHSATGATDNGAGSAVALEVMRILATLKKPMDRTVRIALWSGEEQGLLGSHAYVRNHFADPKTMVLKPEHARLSGYFNLDNGSGKVRGVYLQGNEMMRPVFETWLAPFRDLGVTTISIRNTGGTDHLSFDQVGLPGFQFIQDPLDYSTRTHHSSLDTYDHASGPDLMQAAAVMATCVYETAVRKDMLPRKPLPKPEKMPTPSPSPAP